MTNNRDTAIRRSPRVILVTVLLAFLVIPAYGLFTKIGMAGMSFLKIGVGRSTGMGDAFVAVADDATAAYWNPAGLALVPGRQALVNHIDWIADINHEFVSVVLPTTSGSFGFNVTALTMGEMEETTIEDYQGTGFMFTGTDLAFGASYARMITEKLAFGLSAKVLSEKIWDVSATGAAFDLGIHYNTGWRNLRLAMAIANFGPDMAFHGSQLNFTHDPGWEWPWTREPIPGTYLTENFSLPVVFRFGVAYDFLDDGNSRLTAAADLNHFNDVNEKVNLGLEYNYRVLTARAGYIVNTDMSYGEDIGFRTGLSAGIGLKLRPAETFGLGFDYSYRDLARLGGSHRLTLAVDF
ncbi:MAG: PorV/PorQ family protein [candidate division WOR-3 bacterium]